MKSNYAEKKENKIPIINNFKNENEHNNKPVLIWQYDEAPQELQVSENGGDEDYLALVPPGKTESDFLFLDTNSFGCCGVDEYPGSKAGPEYEGYTIYIGCHA